MKLLHFLSQSRDRTVSRGRTGVAYPRAVALSPSVERTQLPTGVLSTDRVVVISDRRKEAQVSVGLRVLKGGLSTNSINNSAAFNVPNSSTAGGGTYSPCTNHSLRLVTGGANKDTNGGDWRDAEMSQRDRQEISVLERLEDAESRLRHGDRTGMRVLRLAISDLDRVIQERVLIERAQRLGMNAPTVVREWNRYQRQENGDV